MRLQFKKVIVLLEEGFEDLEFWVPLMRLREEGAQVVVASPKGPAAFVGKNGLRASSEVAVAELDPNEWDALVVPGGWAPDKLRRYPAVLTLVRRLYEQNKIIGFICHAGWVAASAGIVRGKRATGSEGIRDDMVNAGAEWVDTPAFRDGNLVWGRVVKDIPDFCRELVSAIEDEDLGL